jgi:hypothetical protein
MNNPNNTRSRAVFSTNDFDLLRRALLFYSQRNYENMTLEDASAVASLMHRLGRIDGEAPHEWR